MIVNTAYDGAQQNIEPNIYYNELVKVIFSAYKRKILTIIFII